MIRSARDLMWTAAGFALTLFLLHASFALVQLQYEVRGFSGQTDVLLRSAGHTLGEIHRAVREARRMEAENYWELKAILGNVAATTRSADALLTEMRQQVRGVGSRSQQVMDDINLTTATVGIAAVRLDQSLSSLNGNLLQTERILMSPAMQAIPENLASVTQKADEAMGHVRDRLNPKKKGFWRTLAEIVAKVPAYLFF